MPIIDFNKNVIQAKIVYYGPGLCGKTTNLEKVNEKVNTGQKLMSIATEGDRTIFFDFLPLELGQIRGISTMFKLYTVPGQVRYNLTRKMVLKNADGIVFVADSQKTMLDSNIVSWENLFDNMRALGVNSEDIPIVLQYNKQDLKNLLSREDLDKALNTKGYSVCLASAFRGDGVMETLTKVCRLVFDKIAANLDGHPKQPPPPSPQPAAVKEPPPAPFPPAKKLAEKPPEKPVEKPAEVQDPQPPSPQPPASSIDGERLVQEIKGLLKEQEKKLAEVFEQQNRKTEEFASKHLAKAEQIERDRTKSEAALLDFISHQRTPSPGSGVPELEKIGSRLDALTAKLATKEEIRELNQAVEKLGKSVEKVETTVSDLGSRPPVPPTASGVENLEPLLKQVNEKLASKEWITELLEQKISDLYLKTIDWRSEVLSAVKTLAAEVREGLEQLAKTREQAPPRGVSPEEPPPAEAAKAPAETKPDEPPAAETTKAPAETKPEEPPAAEAANAPAETKPEEPAAPEEPPAEKKPTPAEDLDNDPRHINAKRIARVMVADLNLYHANDFTEGIKAGDVFERLKNQFEEMRKTFEMRVPEDVRAKKDYLSDAIQDFISKKRKTLGLDAR